MSAYFVLEGADGCGKTTQARRLAERLARDSREVVHLREPGSTPLGEALRHALLDPASGDLDPTSEALAFSAARHEMLRRQVAPALARGAIVVAERCFLSTVAYQCRAPKRDAAPEPLVREVSAAVLAVARPDLVVVLDVLEDVARARLSADGRRDRIEARDPEYHAAVRAAMRSFASPASWCAELLARDDDPAGHSRIALVDGSSPIDVVAAQILAHVAGVLR
ncbi:MAG: dTMP kinase [Planctomycetes bacterium]|nr:dTMP kinase [Planctomycetota bacterium]